MSASILIINGSYRAHGVIQQCVDLVESQCRFRGIAFETIVLREQNINFCTNCRTCTQEPGSEPGHCMHHDDMERIIQKIEAAKGYVLLSPTNFGTVTAVFKRFMERLVVYGYWPWGQAAPQNRKNKTGKYSLLITSSAMPGLLARFFASTLSTMKMASRSMGAGIIKSISLGIVAQKKTYRLSESEESSVTEAVRALLKSVE